MKKIKLFVIYVLSIIIEQLLLITNRLGKINEVKTIVPINVILDYCDKIELLEFESHSIKAQQEQSQQALFAAQREHILTSKMEYGKTGKEIVLPFVASKDFPSAATAFLSYKTDAHRQQVLKLMKPVQLKKLKMTKAKLKTMELLAFIDFVKLYDITFFAKVQVRKSKEATSELEKVTKSADLTTQVVMDALTDSN